MFLQEYMSQCHNDPLGSLEFPIIQGVKSHYFPNHSEHRRKLTNSLYIGDERDFKTFS